jgi:hypothetical protein
MNETIELIIAEDDEGNTFLSFALNNYDPILSQIASSDLVDLQDRLKAFYDIAQKAIAIGEEV